MDQYTSVFDIVKTNDVLKERIKQLEIELEQSNKINKELKKKINNITNAHAVKVLEYFSDCSNIRKTAWAFGFEVEELYHLIPEWDGCNDGLQSADDYDECKIEVYGRKIYDEEKTHEFTKEELEVEREQKMRTPDQDTINKMIEDYNDSNLSLYDLADRYDLSINNLFRLLKENNIIEKETDAKSYGDFYRDYLGSGMIWNGMSNELKLIENFYNVSSNLSDILYN